MCVNECVIKFNLSQMSLHSWVLFSCGYQQVIIKLKLAAILYLVHSFFTALIVSVWVALGSCF